MAKKIMNKKSVEHDRVPEELRKVLRDVSIRWFKTIFKVLIQGKMTENYKECLL